LIFPDPSAEQNAGVDLDAGLFHFPVGFRKFPVVPSEFDQLPVPAEPGRIIFKSESGQNRELFFKSS
jgi:hypothetical protein